MKEIKAIVQRFMVDKVIDGLHEVLHLPGITLSMVHGFSRADRSAKPFDPDEAKMAKIELVVPDALAERVVETITRTAHTGNSGDGKIFVFEVSDVIKIRTGERGEAAI
jgi:nitrogen regulatory protein P-II 1